MSENDPPQKLNEMEEGLVKGNKDVEASSSTRINPFAVREGKKLTWTDVNMTVVSCCLVSYTTLATFNRQAPSNAPLAYLTFSVLM